MNVIDLFAGVGGLSTGFRKAGFNIVLANEIDESIAKSYEKNHGETVMINDDIKNILPALNKINKKIDIIIGGPPCQGFSMAGARIRENKSERFLDDPRNYLFRNYFQVVQKIEPKFFIMENVPGMLSMKDGKIIEEIERLFSDSSNFKNGKYYIYKKVLNAADYGVPQERHRLIIIGSKIEFNFEKILEKVRQRMIKNGEIVSHTIYDAISDLNYLSSGQGEFKQKYNTEEVKKALENNNIYQITENLYNVFEEVVDEKSQLLKIKDDLLKSGALRSSNDRFGKLCIWDF